MLECAQCGVKLPAARHSCSFVNSTLDKYCGGCGASLMRGNMVLKRRQPDDFVQAPVRFTEQELLLLIDLQQQMEVTENRQGPISQDEVDKLFK
jgi:hypothetical protein